MGLLAAAFWLSACVLLGLMSAFVLPGPMMIAAVASLGFAIALLVRPSDRRLLAASAFSGVAVAFGSIAAPLVSSYDSAGIQLANALLALLAGAAAAYSVIGLARPAGVST